MSRNKKHNTNFLCMSESLIWSYKMPKLLPQIAPQTHKISFRKMVTISQILFTKSNKTPRLYFITILKRRTKKSEIQAIEEHTSYQQQETGNISQWHNPPHWNSQKPNWTYSVLELLLCPLQERYRRKIIY